ncbi:MAG: hypothetical protein JO113_04395 [Candidatus Eremiobacteraeota bacterium]|nr:hypothetical protein [Candidatus Eremiobacteraeota bacterium]
MTLIPCGILLASCSHVAGASSPLPEGPANGVSSELRDTKGYAILYNFKGGVDGAVPAAPLLDVNGTLYGTTSSGGGTGCYGSGCGTVFAITTSGQESVLYRFKGGRDGAQPLGSLINVSGILYGTTFNGGGARCYHFAGCGTVFAITASGKERILHRFRGGKDDGAYPWAHLTDVKGTLYGTTVSGGGSSDGTIFTVSTSGAERLLHVFRKRDAAGGVAPVAPLLDVAHTLYGTTDGGGASVMYGTVFSMTTSGKESVLHNFAGGAGDGAYPFAGLIDLRGTLYGTTIEGGSTQCGMLGSCGTVFEITPTGHESVLYHFKGGSEDGWYPQAGLVAVNGTVYGTTVYGGSTGCLIRGCGTIFAITTSGKERILHRFAKTSDDGAYPTAGLITTGGTLYGTTENGGTSGAGTVFRISP